MLHRDGLTDDRERRERGERREEPERDDVRTHRSADGAVVNAGSWNTMLTCWSSTWTPVNSFRTASSNAGTPRAPFVRTTPLPRNGGVNEATRRLNAGVNSVVDRRFGSSAARLASSSRAADPHNAEIVDERR